MIIYKQKTLSQIFKNGRSICQIYKGTRLVFDNSKNYVYLTIFWDYGIESITIEGSSIRSEYTKTITESGSSIKCKLNDVLRIVDIQYAEGYCESMYGILDTMFIMTKDIEFVYNPIESYETLLFRVIWDYGIESITLSGSTVPGYQTKTLVESGGIIKCQYGDIVRIDDIKYEDGYRESIDKLLDTEFVMIRNITFEYNPRSSYDTKTLKFNWNYGIKSVTLSGSTIPGYETKTITKPGEIIRCQYGDIVRIDDITYEAGYKESIGGILNTIFVMNDDVIFEYNPIPDNSNKILKITFGDGIESVKINDSMTISNSSEIGFRTGEEVNLDITFKPGYVSYFEYPNHKFVMNSNINLLISGRQI